MDNPASHANVTCALVEHGLGAVSPKREDGLLCLRRQHRVCRSGLFFENAVAKPSSQLSVEPVGRAGHRFVSLCESILCDKCLWLNISLIGSLQPHDSK